MPIRRHTITDGITSETQTIITPARSREELREDKKAILRLRGGTEPTQHVRRPRRGSGAHLSADSWRPSECPSRTARVWLAGLVRRGDLVRSADGAGCACPR
jgi:hypothetical protein